MDQCESDDGVVFVREGERTRARGGAADYLLAIAEPEAAREAYLRARDVAVEHFRARWEAAAAAAEREIPDGALSGFVQHAALDAMYFYVVHGLPVAITSEDLARPSTRRILRDHAKAFVRPGTRGELAFSAGVLGITAEQLGEELEGERRMLDYR